MEYIIYYMTKRASVEALFMAREKLLRASTFIAISLMESDICHFAGLFGNLP
ncbi:MAG: hypothetical protein K6E98_06750 [Lachnospiraceae bacterium]|nr:hypothetical protein [Lachnospiraceae bacterium]